MNKIYVWILFILAPFLGLFLTSIDFKTSSEQLKLPMNEMYESVEHLDGELFELKKDVANMGLVVENQKQVFNEQDKQIGELSNQSDAQRKLSDDIYERRILNMLGPAVHTHISNRNEIKIFTLAELGYRGYIAKLKLFDPTSLKVVLAQDQLGKLETTSQAVKRKGALFGINGGGFFKSQKNGKPYAYLIGNTVIDGELVEPFNNYTGEFFFAGINKQGQVIGNVPHKEADIMKLNPYQGVSFVPVLLKNGQKVALPSKWANTRQPRTIIGKYANDDLIVIVIDGRRGNWSLGVTLERLQDKLLQLGVKEAYNLDGGGSSAMYYNGKVLNKPSDGRERPVVNNIVVYP